MTLKVMEKSKIPLLIQELAKEYEVIAPVRKESLVSFEKISSGNETSVDLQNTKKSAKEVFFPQTETLFTYKIGEGGVELANAPALKRKSVYTSPGR